MSVRVPSPYLILALDGGGIRGILATRLLERLESAHPGFLDGIDLFAGTSTGGLIALSLAAGRDPHELTEAYRQLGPKAFSDRSRYRSKNMSGLTRSRHDNRPLALMLGELFGDLRMGDLPRSVLVSTFDMGSAMTDRPPRTWGPKFVHNLGQVDSGDRDQRVVDVALRTTAAPTHFPIYQGFVDGGVVANNPSMCALAQALDEETGGQRLEDVWLLSLGTAASPRGVEVSDDDWGLVQWAPHLLPLMFDGSIRMVDYQCRQILGGRYFRIDPTLPRAVGLGAFDEVPVLEEIAAAEDIAEAVTWLGRALST